MIFKTRLLNFILSSSKKNTRHLLLDQNGKWSVDRFTRMYSLLLIGFLIGNLFGTFLNTIRNYIMWDGIIVFFLISFIELLNYNVYHNKNRSFLFFIIHPKIIKRHFWKYFNFFKIGLMVGFFVDAFKVGS